MRKKTRNNYIYLNCSYVPMEIISAAGFTPVRLWPREIGIKGQELIPYDLCPYSRAFLGEILTRNHEKSVFVNSCDAMRRVYDIMADSSFFLEVPRLSGTEEINYYYNQLEKMVNHLDIDPADPVFKDNLQQVISHYNQLRVNLKRLLQDILSSRTGSYLTFIKAVKEYYGPEKADIGTVNLKMSPENNQSQEVGPRVLIISTCLLDVSLVRLIEDIGLRIVGVDSCLGERAFNFTVKADMDIPLKSLARSYLTRPSCPRMMGFKKRITEVRWLFKSRKADGIIYFIPKFCDQSAYDFKYIKDWARDNDIPVLSLESEYGAGNSGQLNTRITAFKEALEM